jgi:Tol biopolymer transport system component
LQRRGALHIVDLSTCRERVKPGRLREEAVLRSPDRRRRASVRTSKDWWSIVVTDGTRSREVYRVTRHYRVVTDEAGPIALLRWSADGRWIFFVIVPDGSASIAADGLSLRVVSATGGRASKIARMLPYRDYLTWCGGRLVFTAGIDRVATNRKRLLVAAPPAWRPRPLIRAPRRSWGSLACAPNGRWLVAQSQRSSGNPNFFATHWALWRVGLDGSSRQLTRPPQGSADESPRLARNGDALLFVRMRRGNGHLYALRDARTVGPLLFLGNNMGYYGHHDWWQTAAWSRGS